MKTTRAISFEDLEERLKVDIRNSNGKIAVIGGHYPLDCHAEPSVSGNFSAFGMFPLYSIKLASKLIRFGKDIGKEIKLALLVDDHSQMGDRRWYMDSEGMMRKTIEKYFKNFSIPAELKSIMNEYGLTEDDMIASENCLAFQEALYRERLIKQFGIDAGCAGEYRLILEELQGKGIKKIIGLIPTQCEGPTCNAVDTHKKVSRFPLKIIHAYLSTNPNNHTESELEEEMKAKFEGITIIRAT